MLDARKGFRPDDPLRALGIRAPAPPALDAAGRESIAAQLIAGTPADSVIAGLVRGGVPLDVAHREVAAAADHPYLRAAQRLGARVAKRDWVLGCRAMMEAELPATVPRRHRLDPDSFHRDHYAALAPVILTGLTDHWPGRQWTLESIAARVGNPEVELQWGREGDADYEANSIAHRRRMPFAAVVERLAADPFSNDFYLTANNNGINRRALDPLWADVGDLPGYLAPGPMGDGFFWMGPRGTLTPWHHDLTQNLLVNMVGTKRVRLVSPAQTPLMGNDRHCFSRFGADPQPPAVRVLTADIGPGEILFIPVGWWHHVEGLSLTIGMSFTNFIWRNDFANRYTTHGAV